MKKTIKILLCAVVFIFMLLIATNVEAATASISASKSTATVGDEVNIVVKYTAAAWDLTVSGNGISTTKYVDVTDDAENTTATKSIKLDTTSAGTKEIKLTGTVSDGTTGETISINTSVNVTVNEKATTTTTTTTGGTTTTATTEPTKGSISSFYINGIKVKEYLTVTNKESVSIKLNTSTGEGATIYNSLTKKSYTVKSGVAINIPILEGTNTLTITLDTGATGTRKIYSQKEEEVKANVIEEPEETNTVEDKTALKSLVIKGVISDEEKMDLSFSPEFSQDVFEYTINLDENLSDITKLDVEAIALQDDSTVKITGNDELLVGENVITITVTSKDGNTIVTYKIIVTKESNIVETSAPLTEVNEDIEIKTDKPFITKTKLIILAVVVCIIAIGAIVFVTIKQKDKNGKHF